MHRRLLVPFLAAALFAGPLGAAPIPIFLTHTGYLLGADDQPVNADAQAMIFRIYDQSAPVGSQVEIWSGTCNVAVSRGYYAAVLGATGCGPQLDSSHLPTSAARYLEVTVGGIAMLPRMLVGTVPTAAVATKALNSDTVGGHAPDFFATAIHLHAPSEITDFDVAAVSAVTSTGLPWSSVTGKPALATVATSGAYADLTGKPTQATVATSGAYADLIGAPALSTVATSGAYADLIGAPALSTVATSGAYADLTGKPALGTAATANTGTTSGTVPILGNGGSLALGGTIESTSGGFRFPDGTVQTTAGGANPATPTCSTGYIAVPTTTLPDGTPVASFCVMKYEAKNSGGAVSTATGALWVSITWTAAKAACMAAGKHLITENEWLGLANNVVNVASNWTNGTVGSGAVYSGHNDNGPANALQASSDDAQGYLSTLNSSPSNQRRTLTLSNGEVVWDLAGNLLEWTEETIPIASRYHGGAGGSRAYWSADGIAALASSLPFSKLPPKTRNATQGMGRYYDGTGTAGATNSVSEAPDNCGTANCASIAAFLRGGYWGNAADAGVFGLDLNRGRAGSLTLIGFRCAGT